MANLSVLPASEPVADVSVALSVCQRAFAVRLVVLPVALVALAVHVDEVACAGGTGRPGASGKRAGER